MFSISSDFLKLETSAGLNYYSNFKHKLPPLFYTCIKPFSNIYTSVLVCIAQLKRNVFNSIFNIVAFRCFTCTLGMFLLLIYKTLLYLLNLHLVLFIFF